MLNDMLRKTDIREEMLTLISTKSTCSLELDIMISWKFESQ